MVKHFPSKWDRRVLRDFKKENPVFKSGTTKVTDSGKTEVKDTLLLQEKQDKLLVDIFDILEKSGYGESSPVHMENYFSNSLDILFWYGSKQTAENNYKNVIEMLKETQIMKLVQEQEDSVHFKSKSWSNLIVRHKQWHTSISFFGSFTHEAIEKAKKSYAWFDSSRTQYEEDEKEEFNRKYRERYYRDAFDDDVASVEEEADDFFDDPGEE